MTVRSHLPHSHIEPESLEQFYILSIVARALDTKERRHRLIAKPICLKLSLFTVPPTVLAMGEALAVLVKPGASTRNGGEVEVNSPIKVLPNSQINRVNEAQRLEP